VEQVDLVEYDQVLLRAHNKVVDQVAQQVLLINLVETLVQAVDNVQVSKVVQDKAVDQDQVVAEILQVLLVKAARRRAVNKKVRKLCVMISRTCKRQLLVA
jgi:hypothetical protein